MKISLRVWILIIALILSVLAIKPSFTNGIYVKSIDKESQLYLQGLRGGERILQINNEKIVTIQDYATTIEKAFQGKNETKLDIKTDKREYVILTNETPKISVDKIPKTRIKTGLDLQGGARALVQPDVAINDKQLDDLVSISRNRFNVYGLSDVNLRGVTDLSGNKYMLIEVA